jgi:hypothetical protein
MQYVTMRDSAGLKRLVKLAVTAPVRKPVTVADALTLGTLGTREKRKLAGGLSGVAVEPYFTISELAELLALSFERARQLVMFEPGVLVFEPQGKRKDGGRGRSRKTYRIPGSVVERILRRHANPPNGR